MPFINADLHMIVAKQHQIDLQKQAEKHRILKTIKADKLALRERFLLGTAGFLISCGLQLRGRVQTADRPTIVSTSPIMEAPINV